MASIREEDEYASAVLGEVGLAAFTDMELKLVAPKGSFAHTELSSSDLRARVEQAVRYRCGLSLVVTLDDGEPHLPETPSLVLVERSRREERRRAAEEEALAHPGIVSLLKTFDGHISATKPF